MNQFTHCLSRGMMRLAAGFLLLLSAAQADAGEFETAFRKQVTQFLDSLDKAQMESCLYQVDDKQRWQMKYTGAKRPGVLIGDLNASQRAAFEKTLRMVLSDHGWAMANKVAQQDGEQGLGKYWLTCFGDPRQGENFAFRLAEHHLTVVQLEVAKGETTEFGPVLLGANPADLWKADEQALLKLWQAIGNDQALIAGQKSIASKPMREGDGVLFSQLGVAAQASLKKAWAQRLSLFTPAIQKRINKLYQKRGGWGKSRICFYHQAPEKRCIDGGRWDFKCGIPGQSGLVWDFESSRGHIHMSLWVK